MKPGTHVNCWSTRAGWNDIFVDELCQPPETFTFGGMLAHIVTFNSYRRLTAAAALRSFGVANVLWRSD